MSERVIICPDTIFAYFSNHRTWSRSEWRHDHIIFQNIHESFLSIKHASADANKEHKLSKWNDWKQEFQNWLNSMQNQQNNIFPKLLSISTNIFLYSMSSESKDRQTHKDIMIWHDRRSHNKNTIEIRLKTWENLVPCKCDFYFICFWLSNCVKYVVPKRILLVSDVQVRYKMGILSKNKIEKNDYESWFFLSRHWKSFYGPHFLLLSNQRWLLLLKHNKNFIVKVPCQKKKQILPNLHPC